MRFLGTGSASSPGGRGHTCILVTHETTTLLLDCGATALPAIVSAVDPATIDGVVVTHLHGDHFAGIPVLLLHQTFAKRAREIVLAGSPSLEARLRELSLALYRDYYKDPFPFPIRVVPFGADEIAIGGARITAVPVAHSANAEPFGVRVAIGGTRIAYTGDAEWSDALPALADGADLFICEATTYQARWAGHLTATEVARRRAELRAARIVLTHLGPEMVAAHDALDLEVANDGDVIRLGAARAR